MNTLRKILAMLLSIGITLTMTGCSRSETSLSKEVSAELTTTSCYDEIQESSFTTSQPFTVATPTSISSQLFKLSDIVDFSSEPYTIINNNIPYFTDSDMTTESFEIYSPLDDLGRCGTAYACIGKDIMPTEERGSIGMIKPSGWQLVKYDNVDGKYLYNRCHLIGYQLSGENANTLNLITGTRYLNIEGMLPFENMVADYVRESGNHVLYRVSPIFDGDDLLCHGVLMEALSVEDNGQGVCFNVFCYNAQPDILIDYANGDSQSLIVNTPTTQAPTSSSDINDNTVPPQVEQIGLEYIVNINTGKFHYPSCSSVEQMAEHNKMYYTGDRDDLIQQGYSPCKRCRP